MTTIQTQGDAARQIMAQRCRYSQVSLTIDPETTFDEWQQIFGVVRQMQLGINFLLGDCINHGEDYFGEKYTQAVHETGHEYQTLVSIAYVCRRIPPAQRRESLSWSQHREMASLPDAPRLALMDRAEKENLATRDIAALVKALKNGEAKIVKRSKSDQGYIRADIIDNSVTQPEEPPAQPAKHTTRDEKAAGSGQPTEPTEPAKEAGGTAETTPPQPEAPLAPAPAAVEEKPHIDAAATETAFKAFCAAVLYECAANKIKASKWRRRLTELCGRLG